MTLPQDGVTSRGLQLRLWPGVALVTLGLLVRYILPLVSPDQSMYAVLALPVSGLAVLLWWLTISRAPWVERVAVLVLIPLAMFGTYQILDKSIATGAQRMLFYILEIPYLGIAFVVWAVATHRLSDGLRRVTMVATILAATGGWALVRTGGFTASDLRFDLHWRWTPTPEDRLGAASAFPSRPPPH